jgi:hypothetical protein
MNTKQIIWGKLLISLEPEWLQQFINEIEQTHGLNLLKFKLLFACSHNSSDYNLNKKKKKNQKQFICMVRCVTKNNHIKCKQSLLKVYQAGPRNP